MGLMGLFFVILLGLVAVTYKSMAAYWAGMIITGAIGLLAVTAMGSLLYLSRKLKKEPTSFTNENLVNAHFTLKTPDIHIVQSTGEAIFVAYLFVNTFYIWSAFALAICAVNLALPHTTENYRKMVRSELDVRLEKFFEKTGLKGKWDVGG